MVTDLIEGVDVKNLKVILDERGWLMEIFRNDDKLFSKFGQVYISAVYPNVLKAWHSHTKLSGNFACIVGQMHIVLYDSRKESPTYGKINQFTVGEKNPKLIHIPRNIFYGFKCISEKTAYLLNVADIAWNPEDPDKIRFAADSEKIPYKWIIDKSKKNE